MAIIFKLYEKLLYALGSFFRKFKACLLFLLPIAIGLAAGFVLGFFGVRELLNLLPFATAALFAGLMAGAYPAVTDQLKGARPKKTHIVLFIVGLAVPIVISAITAFSSAGERSLDNFGAVQYILFLVLGYAVAITQLVPGLSATALLMAVGCFTPLMNSVSLSYWQANPQILLVYAKQLRYLKVIRKKCDEINALVTKMIVLTKSEYELSGGNESIFPDEEIKNFIAANGEEYSNKGLRIAYSGEAVPPLKISSADFARLLVNIADNSLKYKKGAEGRLQIELYRSEEKTVLSFADNGQGVSDEDLPHLFEAFYRADRARSSTESGNGLGLAIVKKIVTAAGGDVFAYNNEQGGLNVRAVF